MAKAGKARTNPHFAVLDHCSKKSLELKVSPAQR